MKAFLDFAPALVFFGAYYKTDIYTATVALIVAMLALVAFYRIAEKRWHKTHLITAVIVTVMGGLTLAIHDPRFIMYKPTVLYAVFALVLLGSHVIGDKVLLQRLPQKTLQLPDPLWRKINFAWALYFAFCAVLNIVVALNFDESTWVQFKTFGFTVLMFVFMLAHIPFVKNYLPQD